MIRRVKRFLLPFLILAAFVTSCEDYEDESRQTSGGGVDEVLIIVDDQYLKTALTDTLAFYFSGYYPVLPQAEPMFDVMIRSYTQFTKSGLLQNHRNIIFTAPLESSGRVANLISSRIGEENIKRAQEDTSFFYAIQRNVFARPQLVIYMFAPTEEELIERFIARNNAIFSVVRESESEKLGGALYYSGTNKEAINKIQEKFNINLKIPGTYTIVNEAHNHIRLTKEQFYRDQDNNITKEIMQNIIIHSFHMDSIDIAAIQDTALESRGVVQVPFALRDSIGKQYIKGVAENFYMYSDKIRPLFQDTIQLNNIQIIESRGLWRMDSPWMGGPYINYTIFDMKNKQILILDGFVYAAGSKKRRLIREIEAIFSSIETQ